MKFLAFCISAATTISALTIPADLGKRIVGGFDMPDNGAPFAVKIAISVGDVTFSCGGSILSKNHIVTAAHCMTDDNDKPYAASQVTLGYGSDNIKLQTQTNASNIVVHPQYNTKTANNVNENDIAIIVVPDMKMDKNTQAISIYNGQITAGYKVVALGWGATVSNNDPNSMPSELKGAVLQVGDKEGCMLFDSNYQSSDGPKICTLNKYSPGNSTCKGDSGTGVVIQAQNGYYLAGLDSQGGRFQDATCGTSDGYTLFTHVNAHLDFIVQSTGLTQVYLARTYAT
ncbi:trypsin-like serine protease [Martensiomyces pterosporus]|nr:trypsin-like serine protease [Martensiomyces pterosporus]